MAKRTIQNCTVIKKAIKNNLEEPLTEQINSIEYCHGYYYEGDEPCDDCIRCKLGIHEYYNFEK